MEYFGVKVDGDDVPIPDELDKPVCKLCNKSISAKRSNTTNLHAHLKDNHPNAYAEVQREKLQESLHLLANQLWQKFSIRTHGMIQSLRVRKKLLAPSLFSH